MEKPKRKRGRPPGIPRDGKYGRGVKTVKFRIPEGQQEYVEFCISDLPGIMKQIREESKQKTSPRYDKLNQFLAELETLCPELFKAE